MEGKIPKMYNRLRVLNPRGCLAMATYVAALAFYIWIRVTKTLDLAQYTWVALPCNAGSRCSAVCHLHLRVCVSAFARKHVLAWCVRVRARKKDCMSRHAQGRLQATGSRLTGPWCRFYGVIVLIIELIGASTVLLYGINLIYTPAIQVDEVSVSCSVCACQDGIGLICENTKLFSMPNQQPRIHNDVRQAQCDSCKHR